MHLANTFILGLTFAVLDIVVAVPQNRNNGNNNNNDNTGNTGNNNAADLNLLAANVQSGSASNGNPDKAEGQSASLTDNANFINFCSGKTLTNGIQNTGGSCNGIVMGDMPSQNNMISSIIVNPGPGDDIKANTDFNIQVQVSNLVAGTFTNPDNTYYAAPQQLSGGKVIGHTHVVVQNLGNSLASKTPPDAKTFAFFKGINDDGNGNGLLAATVKGGLPAGNYRVCTMTSSSNHQPVLMPVAQRGAQDDCQKFTVGGSGSNNNNANANANTGNNANSNQSGSANTGSSNTSSKTSSAASSQSSTSNRNGGQNANSQTGNAGNNVNSNSSRASSSVIATRTTTTAGQQVTSTGSRGGNGQNENGDAGNNQQQSSAASTRTAGSNAGQQTDTAGNGNRNDGGRGRRLRYEAREPIV